MGILFDRQAYTLTQTYGLITDAQLMYEPWWVEGTDVRYFTLACYRVPTNVLVKFHADGLEHEE